jgi:hypothetical protein
MPDLGVLVPAGRSAASHSSRDPSSVNGLSFSPVVLGTRKIVVSRLNKEGRKAVLLISRRDKPLCDSMTKMEIGKRDRH